MNNKTLEFLWELINLFWFSQNIEKSKQHASKIYNVIFDMPNELEELIFEFSQSGNSSAIENLALATAKNRYFSTERHVIIVGILKEKELININEAAQLLGNLDTFKLEPNLAERVRRIQDVVWLVNEDFKDGVMAVNNDSLLAEALSEIVPPAVKKELGSD